MATAQADEWVERLKAGTLNVTDLATVEQLRMSEVLERLRILFPVQFLDRRQRHKWEIGLAQSHRRHARASQSASSRPPGPNGKSVTDTFQHCLFLTSELERLTTVAALNLLRARTPGGAELVELSSGAGFSLYRDADGWKIKLLEERRVSLDRNTLHRRGWQLGREDVGVG